MATRKPTTPKATASRSTKAPRKAPGAASTAAKRAPVAKPPAKRAGATATPRPRPAKPRKATAAAKPAAPRRAAPPVEETSGGGFAGKLKSWSDNLMGFAAPLTNASLALTKGGWKSPARSMALKGGALLLAQTRKSLGLTVSEVARAIDLKNPDLLQDAETGKAALPFEIILRLAAVLGRNDPISFALKLTRAYNPGLWEALEAIGVGRLVEHVGREREFVNIYRGSDAARKLSDAEFAAVLKLVGAAFDLALTFKQGD